MPGKKKITERNKMPSVTQLKVQLKRAATQIRKYQFQLKIYRIKYRFQLWISVFLVIVIGALLYEYPVLFAAPTQDSVTITSDGDWNSGTTDDITVGSGSIEISGDGGSNWISELSWSYRQQINFNNTSGSAHDNFPVMIHIASSNTDFWNNTPSRDEIRFGDSDGTMLDFHFEKFDHAVDDAIAWVEVPNLASGSDHIFLYYNKSGASNGEDRGATYDDDGNYVGVWHMDEETGGTGIADVYEDSTNNSNDGDDYITSTNQDGKIGAGHLFNGSSDHTRHGTDSSMNISTKVTLEAWVKPTNSATYGYIAAKDHYTRYAIFIDADSQLRTYIMGSSMGTNHIFSTADWTHIVSVYDQTSNSLLHYINGVQQSPLSRNTTISPSNAEFVMGMRCTAAGNCSAGQYFYNGGIDEMKLSNTVRSQDWIEAIYSSETDNLISSWGSQEAALQSPGTYTSHNLDVENIYTWGDCTGGSCNGSSAAFTANVTIPANTAALFELRHSANGSTGWSTWTTIHNQTSTFTGTITKTRSDLVSSIGDIFNRYLQVRITLTSSDGTSNPSIDDYQLDFTTDQDGPTNPTSQNGYSDSGMGTGITTATWYSHTTPHFTWSGATDADSGMSGGYAGYWVCFGAVDCEPTSGTFVSSAAYTASSLTTNQTYYLRIKSRDAAGNVASSAYAAFEYRYDTTDPVNPSGVLPNPAGFSNVDSFEFNWNAGTDTGGSGIDEYCYKTGADGAVDTCIPGTTVSSITSYQEGTNKFYVRSKDVAGNMQAYYTSVNYYYSANAPSEPQNLQVDPETNSTNSFEFSWLEPATHANPIAGYYYSVNALPNADNTTYTTSTSVGPDAFATQQGTNIFYVVAIDNVDNIEWTAYSSIEFEASTAAPGIPMAVTITDSSIRAQEKFSLTITWDEPESVGSGIDHYNLEQSEDDGDTWIEISQVTGTGFLDTELTQNAWYCYRLSASDNASAASAYSSKICEQARGRYYVPPDLVGNPSVTARIQSAVIEWLTDREGSSFVEYGETTSYGNQDGQDDFVSAHEVTLIGLKPATTYHYRLKWTDEDSNTGYSNDYTFTTADALSAPTNLTVDPEYNTTNSFTFAWDPPLDEGVTVRGYYYSINSTPTVANTSFTSQTSIGPGPYATQQDSNAFYVVAIDEDNNINYDNYATVNFEAETAAPSIPTGLIITDSSNRENEIYSITLVWKAVEFEASATGDIEEEVVYVVERSIGDDDSFEAIAETTSYGYLDVGLDNTIEYFYKVKAKDSAGAVSASSTTVSDIPEGRYTTPPEITSGPTVTPDSFSAIIVWDTERNADSHVEYGITDALGEEQGTIEEGEKHSVSLEGLMPETTYYYHIRSRDIDGNVAISTVTTFATLEAPRVSNVEVSDIKLYDGLITWSTNKATTSRIEYGTSTGYGSVVYDPTGSLTKSHTMKLTGLTDGTTYHFRPTGQDASGNPPESGDYSFTTLTFPEVLSVSYENKSEGQTEVSWTTNVPTTSIVEYYNEQIAPKTQGNTAQVAEHVILLYGLEDATTYQFKVRGVDQFGYSATSDEREFTTLEDTTPPEIFGTQSESNTIGSGDESSVQIVISWKTNEPTTSQVEYGVGLSSADFTDQTDENAELVMDHLEIITGLAPAKTYHFRVVSSDKAGNQSKSGSYTVLTTRTRSSFLQLVIENLETTFSWMGNIGGLF